MYFYLSNYLKKYGSMIKEDMYSNFNSYGPLNLDIVFNSS